MYIYQEIITVPCSGLFLACYIRTMPLIVAQLRMAILVSHPGSIKIIWCCLHQISHSKVEKQAFIRNPLITSMD